MKVCHSDRSIVRWAVKYGYLFRYCSAADLQTPCLEVVIGYVTAYFHGGHLVRIASSAEGRDIEHLMYDLNQLFSLCTRESAYLEQRPFLTQLEKVYLQS